MRLSRTLQNYASSQLNPTLNSHPPLSSCEGQFPNGSGGTLRGQKPCPSYTSLRLVTEPSSTQQPRESNPNQPHRHLSSSALFMVGGGEGDGSPGSSSSSSTLGTSIDSIKTDGVAVQLGSITTSTSTTKLQGGGTATEEDVPRTVHHNGETLTFGDYRPPWLAERAFMTLASFGSVGWKSFSIYRQMRRKVFKALVVVVAPCIAWLVRFAVSRLYKETVLQPKLRSPESVAFPNSRFKNINDIKVHYLRETPPEVDRADSPPSCILHMNHGFGASALSWTPVISKLSGALGALTIAHDTPGFGLTSRASLRKVAKYSLRNNAAITRELVRDAEEELRGATGATATSPRYILMGHSMGCITAATAAIDSSLPPHQTTLVIVAPALSRPSKSFSSAAAVVDLDSVLFGGAKAKVTREGSNNEGSDPSIRGGGGGGRKRAMQAFTGVPTSAVRAVGDAAAWLFNWCLVPLIYPFEIVGLRALVYRGNFWREGLRFAWFDKSRVDVDAVNRYRWPSLVRHWDRGMALFVLGRLQIGQGGSSGPPGLVEAVAAKAAQGMKVVIVQGEDDTVVKLAKTKDIADAIPEAKLVVLPDCGHVPHEERPDDFLRVVLEQLQ